MTVVIAAGALVLLALLAAVSSVIARDRTTAEVMTRLELEVTANHAGWRTRSGVDDSLIEEMNRAGAALGRLLDSVGTPDASAPAVPSFAAAAARLGAPLSARLDFAPIAQAYLEYVAEANRSVHDGGPDASRRLEDRFLALTQTIGGLRAGASEQAAVLTMAVNWAAAMGLALGALVLLGMAWRGERPRPGPSTETGLMLPRVAQPVVLFDRQGVIRQAEGHVERALGHSKATLIGTSLAGLAHDDDFSAVERFVAQYSADPKGTPAVEFRPRSVDGVWLALEAVGGRRQGDASGHGSIVKLVDVTSRKNAEEALRRSSEVFATLVDAMPLAIIIEDSDGLVQLWNVAAEQLFGWTAEQVVGRVNPALPVAAAAEHGNLRKRIHEGQAFTGLEAKRVKSDGTTFEASITAAPLKRSDGRHVDVMEVIIDTTDRRELETQLRQAQKMEAIGRLAGGIAHDFNNLLTAIMGHADMLLKLPMLSDASETSQPASTVRFGVDQICQAGQRAAALTQQLLAFSRAQVLQPTILNLNSAVADMEPMLRRLIGEDVDLAVMPGANLESIKADATQIAQVVMNLALNARDAMPTGGRLTIETHNVELDEVYGRRHVPVIPGPYVLLAVSDTGVGMNKETQDRVFEPFFTTKEKGQGTGLGLATVYGIVRQSGGYIWVYSEPGHGTSFKVYLPSVEKRLGPQDAVARPSLPPLNGSETILLVEDEEMVRALVHQVLTWYDYNVLAAVNGESALKVAAEYPGAIDLMLTDIVMPGMSALDLVRELHILRPTTKVLYMSGYTDHAVVRNSLLNTNQAFLQKPFAPDRLAHKVRELLSQQDGARQQNGRAQADFAHAPVGSS